MLTALLASAMILGASDRGIQQSSWGWFEEDGDLVCKIMGESDHVQWGQWGSVDSDATMPYSAHTNGLNGDTSVNQIYVAAAKEWNKVSCSDFRFMYDNPTIASRSVPSNDGRPHIKFQGGQGWLAACWLIYGGGGNRECDIEIEPDYNWYIGTGNPGWQQFDLYSVVVHELGHAFGLDHSSDSSAIMWPYISNGTKNRVPTQDDQNGICALY